MTECGNGGAGIDDHQEQRPHDTMNRLEAAKPRSAIWPPRWTRWRKPLPWWG